MAVGYGDVSEDLSVLNDETKSEVNPTRYGFIYAFLRYTVPKT